MKEYKIKDYWEVAPTIKDQRKEQKVTQEDLANFSGLSRIGVVKLEKGGGK